MCLINFHFSLPRTWGCGTDMSENECVLISSEWVCVELIGIIGYVYFAHTFSIGNVAVFVCLFVCLLIMRVGGDEFQPL